MTEKFYITTAIDYPNSDPHMGHAYEKIIADVLARWHRIKSEKVFFSYGLDEHGSKIHDTAKEAKLTPIEFVDKQHKVFSKFIKSLLSTNDVLVRTTGDEHKKLAKELFQKVLDKGEIYKGEYSGNYCKYEETFYTDLQLVDGKCPECGRETKIVSEEAYFFKLSLYKDKLIEHIENNERFIVPETRRNEILSRLRGNELRDLCVSRSSFDWGIPLPNDPSHVIYVWFDALINYLTAIHYPNEMWPADVHVIGKDILWFHAVIWPAMLMSLEIDLPETIYAHGFINDKNGRAMSKSLNNGIDPNEIIDKYGIDALRFYLMRSVPSGEDGNFNEDELIEKYNKELGNDLGNVVKRLEVLSQKYFEGNVDNEKFTDEIKVLDNFNNIDKEFYDLKYNRALDLIWKELNKVNAYLNKKEPWKNEDGRKSVLYNALESIRFITHLLYAFIPESCEKIAKQFGFEFTTFDKLKFGDVNYSLSNHDVLFPKIEVEKEEKKIFPLNLRVGKVTSVKQHPDADKLFVEQIDFGTEKSQVVSGLAEHFKPEEIEGKNVIIVSNLKKAKLRGVESFGMLLVGQKDDKMSLLESSLEPGTYITIDGYENKTTNLKFDDFLKVKLEVKDKEIFFEGNKLEGIFVDIDDGADVS